MRLASVFIFLTLFIAMMAGCTTESPPVNEVVAQPSATLTAVPFTPTPTISATSTPSPIPPSLTPTLLSTDTTVPACSAPEALTAYPAPATNIPTYTYRVLNIYPHDKVAFTQGLLYHNGWFYESTGSIQSPSSLRRVNFKTGEVLQRIELSAEFFGEGLVLWQDRFIQLTWQNNVAFVYDKDSFEPINQFSYPTEGWGITHDGRCLIMSDGTNNLYFRDPETFAEIGRLPVFDNEGPVIRLNELEYINGEVYANIWQTNRIARISPQTGQVLAWIDMTGVLDHVVVDPADRIDVLNGIAYDAENGRLFVTGKLWPAVFEIELVPLAE